MDPKDIGYDSYYPYETHRLIMEMMINCFRYVADLKTFFLDIHQLATVPIHGVTIIGKRERKTFHFERVTDDQDRRLYVFKSDCEEFTLIFVESIVV